MLFYRAALPLSRQTLSYVAGIIRRHRVRIGSCWRKLKSGRQALLVLAHLRKGETFTQLAAGFGVGMATAWRYVTETVRLLAARSPRLAPALRAAKQAAHAFVVIDGTLIAIGPPTGPTPSCAPPGERANAQLKTWPILRKLRCCPWQAGRIAKASTSSKPGRSEDEKGALINRGAGASPKVGRQGSRRDVDLLMLHRPLALSRSPVSLEVILTSRALTTTQLDSAGQSGCPECRSRTRSSVLGEGKHTMRNVLRRIVPAAVVITGLAIATLPAIPVLAASATTAHLVMNAKPASPAHVTLPGLKVVPAQQAASFHICLINSSPFMCEKSNGAGNQVTISRYSTDWSNFTIVRMTTCCGGLAVYQFENGNGNCLRAGTNNVVKIENGGCASSDNADSWLGVGSGRLQSALYGDLMLTHGAVSGYKVWHAARISGDWTDWAY